MKKMPTEISQVKGALGYLKRKSRFDFLREGSWFILLTDFYNNHQWWIELHPEGFPVNTYRETLYRQRDDPIEGMWHKQQPIGSGIRYKVLNLRKDLIVKRIVTADTFYRHHLKYLL